VSRIIKYNTTLLVSGGFIIYRTIIENPISDPDRNLSLIIAIEF